MVQRNLNPALVLAATALCVSSQALDPVPCGSVACYNGGKCVDFSFSTHGTGNNTQIDVQQESRAETTGALLTFCRCPVGFTGLLCNIQHDDICRDSGDTCRSGHACTQNKVDDSVFECPCDVAYSVSEFAGLMCQTPATEYCDQWNHELGHQHFCTNGGVCKSGLIPAGETTNSDGWARDDGGEGDSCICAPEFEGSHCQNLKGYGVPPDQARGGQRSVEAEVGITMFLVMIFSVIAFAAAVVIKRHVVGTHVNPATYDDGDDGASGIPKDLQLDCHTRSEDSDDPKEHPQVNNISPTSVSNAPHDTLDRPAEEQRYNTFDIDQIVQVQEDIHEDKFV